MKFQIRNFLENIFGCLTTDEEGRVSCAEFDRVMHFVDGSYDLSAKVFSESKRLFNSFEDFVKYCQAKKTEE